LVADDALCGRYRILQEIADKMPNGAFVATSNVDGQFQKAGFSEQRIYELHGSIHRLQCMDKFCETRSAQPFMPEVDEENCRLSSELTRCFACGGIVRPNILMFADWGWNDHVAEVQQMKLRGRLGGVKKLVVIEIGAGKNIPTIRNLSERQEGKVIRINPKDYWPHPGKGVSLQIGGLEALMAVQMQMKIWVGTENPKFN
jgi:NAD-dependent SIR2 family protein deacetylase